MYPHLHTVGLVVKDMSRSLAFYRLLGLDIDPAEDKSPHVEFSPATGCSIGFVSEAMVRQTDPKWTDGHGHRVNLQFSCADAPEVDATHARLVVAGHVSYQAPWDAFWGQRFARVIDPDGNVVNLFAPLAEAA